jgi:hypothetical protein
VWAVAENPKLTINDIGVDLDAIDSQAENVRKWIYRMLGARLCSSDPSADEASRLREYISVGSRDVCVDVRISLAAGLKDTYHPIIESSILEWTLREADREVLDLLCEHMVRHSLKSANYLKFVLDIYQHEPDNSIRRSRLEAHAAGMRTYSMLKAVQKPDLLGGGSTVVNKKTFNFHGNVQAPGSSFGGGDVTNSDATTQLKADVTQHLLPALQQARGEVAALEEEGLAEAAIANIDAAIASPTRESVEKAVKTLESVRDGAAAVEKTANAAASIGASVKAIMAILAAVF